VKIYTRTGDGGRTKLFGGVEVSKQDLRVDAYGTLDELNAVLGTVLALDRDDEFGIGALGTVQEDLFAIGSRLAAARPERELTRRTIPGLARSPASRLDGWVSSKLGSTGSRRSFRRSTRSSCRAGVSPGRNCTWPARCVGEPSAPWLRSWKMIPL
jgi:cob(I)alamin adenosyltransferase